MVLWQLATYAVTGFALLPAVSSQIKVPNTGIDLPPPVPREKIPGNEHCEARWRYEPSFMMWLVRITIRYHFGTQLDRGTGSLISRRHVLTSCYPAVKNEIYFHDNSELAIYPAMIRYANVTPDEENGTFPWAMKDDQCFINWFSVYSTIAPRGCNIGYQVQRDQPFLLNATADNYLILALNEEIKLVSANSQYMPFDFNLDRNMRTIKWFQSMRIARCFIPRFTPTKSGQKSSTQSVEQVGFTYRSMPFKDECLLKLCKRYCSSEANFAMHGGSRDECNHKCAGTFGRRYQGRLLCLQRMNENIKGDEKYWTPVDDLNVQTPLKPVDAPHKETCSENSVVHGAPVICNGEVIAIVSVCFERDEDDPYLLATTLNSIRHQLLRWGPLY